MDDWLVFSVVVVALIVGWLLGNRSRSQQTRPAMPAPLHDEYFVGLNYLLSDRTDEAIDAFIRALEVNSETIPAYLALARLFRRKGDVERAIKVHQSLLARPDLSRSDSLKVQIALAKDYDAIGLLDRAETLLSDIVRQDPPVSTRNHTLRLLIKLYEKEREWFKATQASALLEPQARAEIAHEVAHYYCERAAHQINSDDLNEAQRLLEKAASTDPNCVRTSMLLAQLQMTHKDWKLAIKHLQRVEKQDVAFVSETVSMMRRCHDELGTNDELLRYFEHCMSVAPSASVMLAIAELIKEDRGAYAAGAYITDELKHYPTIKGFNRLIDLHLSYGGESARDSLRTLRSLTGTLEMTKPRYRCQNCGYAGKVLLWHCPSCRKWSSTKPVQGLEGE